MIVMIGKSSVVAMSYDVSPYGTSSSGSTYLAWKNSLHYHFKAFPIPPPGPSKGTTPHRIYTSRFVLVML